MRHSTIWSPEPHTAGRLAADASSADPVAADAVAVDAVAAGAVAAGSVATNEVGLLPEEEIVWLCFAHQTSLACKIVGSQSKAGTLC